MRNIKEALSLDRRRVLAAGVVLLLGYGSALANAPDPVAFITAIYRAAVEGHGPSWIDKGERPRYLSKSLVALWAKSDKKIVSGDEGPIDFDLVTATQGLALASFTLAVEKQDEKTATIAATLVYTAGDPGPGPTIVRYDLVRESGQWKIDEIRGRAWSTRTLLTNFLRP